MDHGVKNIIEEKKLYRKPPVTCSILRVPCTRWGFTLIELLVVVSIISLLSSIVFSGVVSQRAKARDARRFAELFQVRRALDLYFDANGSKYPPLPSVACGTWSRSDAGLPGAPQGYPATCWTDLSTALQPWRAQFPVDPVNSTIDTVPYIYAYQQRNGGAGYRLATVLETSTNLGEGCALLDPVLAPSPAGFPASFYCIGENWQ
ncbi:MAG: type II secretion system protein [bacterium]|nr:type II secretion system protein [bacterium]